MLLVLNLVIVLHRLNSLICYNNYYVGEKYQNKLLNWISWLSWFMNELLGEIIWYVDLLYQQVILKINCRIELINRINYHLIYH
jgi:hypothetical protein